TSSWPSRYRNSYWPACVGAISVNVPEVTPVSASLAQPWAKFGSPFRKSEIQPTGAPGEDVQLTLSCSPGATRLVPAVTVYTPVGATGAGVAGGGVGATGEVVLQPAASPRSAARTPRRTIDRTVPV